MLLVIKCWSRYIGASVADSVAPVDDIGTEKKAMTKCGFLSPQVYCSINAALFLYLPVFLESDDMTMYDENEEAEDIFYLMHFRTILQCALFNDIKIFEELLKLNTMPIGMVLIKQQRKNKKNLLSLFHYFLENIARF